MKRLLSMLAAVAASAVIGVGVPGCATGRAAPGGIPEALVVLTPDQSAAVDGKTVPLPGLPACLTALGAGDATVVKIQYQSPNARLFAEIVRTLQQAGFVRVVFVGPRQVRAAPGLPGQ